MTDTNIKPFGDWPSPISPEAIFQARQTPGYPVPWQGGVLFLLTMPEEENAQALMFAPAVGTPWRISPPGFNLRTRVHEYGGLPFATAEDAVFFCNFKDQEIYRQAVTPAAKTAGTPQRLTSSQSAQVRYSDLLVDSRHQRLLCVREDHRHAAGQASKVINALVAIKLDNNDTQQADAQTVLFQQSDFVAGPCLSPDGQQLAFVTWSHPNMPFDNTEIRLAWLAPDGAIARCVSVDAGEASAKTQPAFDTAGDLYFLSDRHDFWNLMRLPQADFTNACRSQVAYAIDADCCAAPWQSGNHNFAFGSHGELLISVTRACRWQLHRVVPGGNDCDIVESDLGQLEHLCAGNAGEVFYLAASDSNYAALKRLPSHDPASAPETVYQAQRPGALQPELISRPQHFDFTSSSGATAYGLLFLPCNPGYRGPDNSLPPLLVNVHGGPTGTARAVLNPLHQFWTSRGFAVLDLNHRGSTGYGRRFRQLLYGQWGVVDIADVVAAVEYLVDSGQVDPHRVAIRGGSAGGYAVLASLAACDLFAAGVSYYGVSDLELLARDTHKFESRYLDQLIGPYPEQAAEYQARSPIHHLRAITAPVLLLQGEDDRVVPMNQAETIHRQLSALNPATELLCFSEEGHGFRKPANQIRALQAELRFYRRNLLGLEAAAAR